MTKRNAGERGGALIVVLMVTLVLLGLGLIALRQTRTEALTTGNLRASRQAYQAAHSGLIQSTSSGINWDVLHRRAVQNSVAEFGNVSSPFYVFGAEQTDLPEPGFFELDDPFGGEPVDSLDHERVGKLEYRTTMSRPRLAAPPPRFTIAGGQGTMFVFYTYQFDVLGFVNREPGSTTIQPGRGGARKAIRADVRVGPIALQQ